MNPGPNFGFHWSPDFGFQDNATWFVSVSLTSRFGLEPLLEERAKMDHLTNAFAFDFGRR